ncbi:MAG: hypothetical protein ACKVOR_00120 [Flavobacteriales bacterium]
MRLALLLLFIAACAMPSCRREEPTTWNTEVLAPVAHGRITLANLVSDTLLQADEDGLWHLLLHESLTDLNLDSLVALPDTVIEKIVDIPLIGGPFTIPNNTTLIDENDNNLININDVEMKQVVLKSGLLKYKLKSYINGYIDFAYTLPGVTLNGVPVVINTIALPAVGETPSIYEGEINLAGYNLDMTGETGFMHNRVHSHTVVKTWADAPQPAVVYGDDYVKIELEFHEPMVQYARGYFGHHIYTFNEDVDFSDDINLPVGMLNIDDAYMHLNIRNAVGADMRVQFSNIAAHNSAFNQDVQLMHAPLYQAINIERASDDNGSVTATSYNFDLNTLNSNIDEFIENLPNQLNVLAEVELNPLKNNTDGNDFIYTDDALSATFDLDIPLRVGMQSLTMRDTMLLASDLVLEASGELKLLVTNTFPFSTTITAYIVSADGSMLGDFIPTQTIEEATATAQPMETIAANSQIAIPVSQHIINQMKAGNGIVVIIALDTPAYPTTAGLYSHHYIDYILVADGVVQVEIE